MFIVVFLAVGQTVLARVRLLPIAESLEKSLKEFIDKLCAWMRLRVGTGQISEGVGSFSLRFLLLFCIVSALRL